MRRGRAATVPVSCSAVSSRVAVTWVATEVVDLRRLTQAIKIMARMTKTTATSGALGAGQDIG